MNYTGQGYIAKGSFGEVHKVYHISTGQTRVAKTVKKMVKINNSLISTIKSFENEAEILRVLQKHPHIIEFHETVEEENKNSIIMEFAQGGDLLKHVGKCDLDTTLMALHYLMQALFHMHTMDIVSRDIKPGNIVLRDIDDFSTIKLIDFGSAVQMDKSFQTAFSGTYAYDAPETKQDSMVYKTSDVWSVGVTCSELYFGYRNTSKPTFTRDLFYDEQFCRLPEPVRRVFKGMLEKDPVQRWTSSQVLNALRSM